MSGIHRFVRVMVVLGGLLASTMLGLAGAGASPAGDRVGRYIVVLDDDVNPHGAASDHARAHGARVDLIYRHALKGYAATMSPQAAARISADPRVAFVEADQVAHTFSQVNPTGVERIFADGNANIGIDGTDDWRVDVDVAVIDTGVDHTHPDIAVVAGTDCTGGGPFNGSCKDGLAGDGNGHGTHVAGTVAAIDNGDGVVGVAPGARLHAVKVLRNDGSGYLSWIVAGIDWVTAQAGTIEVANMSLGCECSSAAMDAAITSSVEAGVVYAVAAGNSDKNADTFSPANHPDVITVSALADFDGKSGALGSPTCRTDQDDTLADFSNYGIDVEVAAPGVCIRSTWPGGGYNTISGTSMASPHVAGAAALLASMDNPGSRADVEEIGSKIALKGNINWTDDSRDGDHEPLLDVSDTTVFIPKLIPGSSDGDGGSPNASPTASFTYSCTDLTCSFNDASDDTDGTVASWSWEFGDGNASTAQDPTHAYEAGGTYTVTLTVTDDAGATDSESQSVTVTDASEVGITLSATGHKVKGVQHADLRWTGATSTNVDVYRNSSEPTTTTANDGAHTDNIGNKGGGSYTYQVCEAETTTCSNAVTVSF